LAIAVVVTLCGIATVSAQEPEMSAEAQEEMAAWMALAQPGEHHKHLEPYAGKWKTEIKMWMGPGSEPMLNESEVEAHWIMDGRFLEWSHTGNFAGMPYMARGFEAYNNGDKRYEAIHLDNFGTLMVFYTGECSDDGKTRVMHGSFGNPMTGGTIEQKSVYTWIDDDHLKLESFMTMNGETYQNMEMLYERQ
jgi:hypothetical protein